MFCVFACIYLCMEICEPLKLFLFTFPMGSEFFFFRPLSLGLVPAFLRRFFLVVFFLHSSSLVKVWNVSHAFYFPVCCFCCCFAYFFFIVVIVDVIVVDSGWLPSWLVESFDPLSSHRPFSSISHPFHLQFAVFVVL